MRSWHDDGLSDCAFLESSMFRTSNPPFFGRESGSTPDKSFGLVPSFQRVAVNCLLHLHDYTTWMFIIYIYIYILHIFKYSKK